VLEGVLRLGSLEMVEADAQPCNATQQLVVAHLGIMLAKACRIVAFYLSETL
jgi:hypothetical protein